MSECIKIAGLSSDLRPPRGSLVWRHMQVEPTQGSAYATAGAWLGLCWTGDHPWPDYDGGDFLAFGEAVGDALVDLGASCLEVIEAGGVATRVAASRLGVGTEEEAKAAEDFSSDQGEPSTSA